VFVSGGSQQVRTVDDHTLEITVQAIRPDQPAAMLAPDPKPAAGDLESNSLIQSDAPKVAAMAAQVAPDETDPWKLACALESHVRRSIRSKNFSQAFATAAEVAESLEGDCTEHAVLLAALCRARKIPARVAIGLVYYPQAQGFAYHMWNEVWIGDRWVPLDGTLGQGGIGAAHLKLAHSDLRGASAYSAFLPVFRVLGQLKLEVTSVEPPESGGR
jgi:transglutaminase-like putative cysteine protease